MNSVAHISVYPSMEKEVLLPQRVWPELGRPVRWAAPPDPLSLPTRSRGLRSPAA